MGKTIADHISHEGLSKIYKEFLKLNRFKNP